MAGRKKEEEFVPALSAREHQELEDSVWVVYSPVEVYTPFVSKKLEYILDSVKITWSRSEKKPVVVRKGPTMYEVVDTKTGDTLLVIQQMTMIDRVTHL
jgi:hypothetical protein